MMKYNLLSLKVTVGAYQQFIDEIVVLAKHKSSSYVCVANAHMLVEAYKDNEFKKVVDDADITTPDGMPLCKAMQLLYGVKQERVAGMDLLPDLLHTAEEEDIPVYFYGGTDEMIGHTTTFLKTQYKRLHIAGLYSPPFRPLTPAEETSIVAAINNSGAALVFVALGCPKQEKWMASMKGRINGCMVGIGGALPVMVGMQKRAPNWMQKNSLEWLYRLSQEPARLFKRYAVTNTIFVRLFLKQWVKQGFKPISPAQQ